jgi:VIT1/CCC1 family predicted Fe2+/Mn2+ transporter
VASSPQAGGSASFGKEVDPFVNAAVRAILSGILAVTVSYLVGFIVPGLQNVFMLAFIFVVAVIGTVVGWGSFPEALKRHPNAAAWGAGIVGIALILGFLFLMTPKYIVPWR